MSQMIYSTSFENDDFNNPSFVRSGDIEVEPDSDEDTVLQTIYLVRPFSMMVYSGDTIVFHDWNGDFTVYESNTYTSLDAIGIILNEDPDHFMVDEEEEDEEDEGYHSQSE